MLLCCFVPRPTPTLFRMKRGSILVYHRLSSTFNTREEVTFTEIVIFSGPKQRSPPNLLTTMWEWESGGQDAVVGAVKRAEEPTKSCYLLSPTLLPKFCIGVSPIELCWGMTKQTTRRRAEEILCETTPSDCCE